MSASIQTQVGFTDREIYQQSSSRIHVYFCAVFPKRTIYPVTQYFYHLSQLNLLHLAQLKKIYIHGLFMESTPFSIFCDIICRNHFRSWGHLRSNLGIICGTGITCGPGSFAGPYSAYAITKPLARVSAFFPVPTMRETSVSIYNCDIVEVFKRNITSASGALDYSQIL